MSEIKKSDFRPGDTRLPHENLNAYNDAARQVSSGKRQMDDVVGGITSKANTVYAYNASGEDAPWRGICEISDTSNTTAQVEFVKPGASDGIGQYGILLEPVKDGSLGRIAISGGPWEVGFTGGSVGDELGVEDDSWDAVEGDLFEVMRGVREEDNICKVRFSDKWDRFRSISIFTSGAGSANGTVTHPDSSTDSITSGIYRIETGDQFEVEAYAWIEDGFNSWEVTDGSVTDTTWTVTITEDMDNIGGVANFDWPNALWAESKIDMDTIGSSYNDAVSILDSSGNILSISDVVYGGPYEEVKSGTYGVIVFASVGPYSRPVFFGVNQIPFPFDDSSYDNNLLMWDHSNNEWVAFDANQNSNGELLYSENGSVYWNDITGGTVTFENGSLEIDHLGFEDLSDPDHNTLLFWNNSTNQLEWAPSSPQTALMAYDSGSIHWIIPDDTLTFDTSYSPPKLALNHLGLEDLSDPNEEGKILEWDDTNNKLVWGDDSSLPPNPPDTSVLAYDSVDDRLEWFDIQASSGIEIVFLSSAFSILVDTGSTLGFNVDGGLELSHLGIEDLSDPNADKYMMWDDTEGKMVWVEGTSGDVKVSSNDSNSDYLGNKVTAGNGIDVTEKNDGGDEDLEVALDLTDITGYSGTSEQVLVNDNGSFKWVGLSDFSCPE